MTEAGKRLLANFGNRAQRPKWTDLIGQIEAEAGIVWRLCHDTEQAGRIAAEQRLAAIEAEATAAAEQRLRERIEALRSDRSTHTRTIEAVLNLLSGGSPATPGPTGPTVDETPPDGLPASAASPRQGEPVDVERLAEALFRTQAERRSGLGSHEADAGCIAAEYAALSEPAEAGEPA